MSNQPPSDINKVPLEPEFQALVDDGALRLITESRPGCFEFAIDPLAHRMRGGGGWIDIDYRLTADMNAGPDESRYVVEDDSEQGGEVLHCSNDADDVAAWISSEIEDKG